MPKQSQAVHVLIRFIWWIERSHNQLYNVLEIQCTESLHLTNRMQDMKFLSTHGQNMHLISCTLKVTVIYLLWTTHIIFPSSENLVPWLEKLLPITCNPYFLHMYARHIGNRQWTLLYPQGAPNINAIPACSATSRHFHYPHIMRTMWCPHLYPLKEQMWTHLASLPQIFMFGNILLVIGLQLTFRN